MISCLSIQLEKGMTLDLKDSTQNLKFKEKGVEDKDKNKGYLLSLKDEKMDLDFDHSMCTAFWWLVHC